MLSFQKITHTLLGAYCIFGINALAAELEKTLDKKERKKSKQNYGEVCELIQELTQRAKIATANALEDYVCAEIEPHLAGIEKIFAKPNAKISCKKDFETLRLLYARNLAETADYQTLHNWLTEKKVPRWHPLHYYKTLGKSYFAKNKAAIWRKYLKDCAKVYDPPKINALKPYIALAQIKYSAHLPNEKDQIDAIKHNQNNASEFPALDALKIMWLAEIQFNKKNFDQARKLLRSIKKEIWENNISLKLLYHYHLAKINFAVENWQICAIHAQKALETWQNNPQTKQKNVKIPEFLHECELLAINSEIKFNKEKDQLLKKFEKFLFATPPHPPKHISLAIKSLEELDAFSANNKNQEVQQLVEKLARASSRDISGCTALRRAQALVRNSSYGGASSSKENGRAEAISLLENSMLGGAKHACYEEALLLLANIYLKSEEDEAIADYIVKLLKQKGGIQDIAKMRYFYAQILAKQGKYAKALQNFNLAGENLQDTQAKNTALANAEILSLWLDAKQKSNLQAINVLAANVLPKNVLPENVREYNLCQKLAKNSAEQAADCFQKFLNNFPNDVKSGSARLFLAEYHFASQKPDLAKAREELKLATTTQLSQAELERADYLDFWLTTHDGDLDKAEKVCQKFVARWPNSPLLANVLIKRAQIHYQRGNYAEAKKRLLDLVELYPDSPHKNIALWLAGKCAMALIDEQNLNQAIEIFDNLRNDLPDDSELALKASFQQALVLRRQGKNEAALDLLAKIGQSCLDLKFINLYCHAQLSRAEILSSISSENVDAKLDGDREAIKILDKLATNSEIPSLWKSQFFCRLGQIHESLGELEQARKAYTLAYARSFVNLRKDKFAMSPEELSWIYRAGFRLVAMHESNDEIKEAIKIAARLKTFEGERSNEARDLENNLKLKHFYWDKNEIIFKNEKRDEAEPSG